MKRGKVKNNKAQGMSTSTIILLILGLVILVVLVLGFTMGWSKFLPFISKPNLDGIQQACNMACSSNGVYNYCSLMRDVKDGENNKFSATCNQLATTPLYKNRGYGIAECPGLCD